MRIALITTSFFPQVGGAEFVVHHLASQWAAAGHEVCIFQSSHKESWSDADAGYSVRNYPIPPSYLKLSPHWPPFSWYITRGIRRGFDIFKPELVSAHFGYPVGVWLSQMDPVPKFLVTCHGRELTKFYWGDRAIYKIDKVLARALNASAGAIAISSHAKRLMLELGVMPERILTIPNGVDLPRFRQTANFDLRGRFGIAPEATIILSVGREHPQKAYDSGIRAFASIAGKHPEAHYVILGKGTKRWQQMVDDLQLHGRVILSDGLQGEDLVGAYQQADVFFSPSIWELMPLVVLEAMAAGLPLLVTDVSGSQDLVQSGANGFLVEPGNVEEMALFLARLVADRALRREFGAVNSKLADNYSWQRIAQRYLEAAEFGAEQPWPVPTSAPDCEDDTEEKVSGRGPLMMQDPAPEQPGGTLPAVRRDA